FFLCEEGNPEAQKQTSNKSQKSAAHLVGETNADGKLIWVGDVDHAFLRTMKLVNNSLVIPEDGLYFVYSQVVFRGSSCPYTLLTHEILRFSDSYPVEVPLLSASKSICSIETGSHHHQHRPHHWHKSIYQGAVFSFNRGDKLSTLTEHVSLLDLEQGKTFFGAFAL
uniref:Tumor necrosis factor n=2 Tax=Latimeria chalumnae TaxID=7897 RepID=H3ADP4_LATCH